MTQINNNAGLTSGWADGEAGWGGPMNANLVATDNLLHVGVIHVRTHGAKGDGTTDDKAAIQAAIDAATAGQDIYFARGTYMVTGQLVVVTSGVTLTLAPGATLKAKTGFPASTPMLKIGDGSVVYSNITVRGGKFDGNSLANWAIHATGPNKNVQVHNVEVTLTLSTSINIEGVTAGNPAIGVAVTGCYVHDVNEGIQAFKATDVLFANNRVENISGGTTPNDCLEVSQVTRFVIADNLCRNPGGSNACIDVFENSSDGIVVGNVISIATATTGTSGISIDHSTTANKRLLIANNVISGGFGSGISASPGQSEITIIGNLIRDMDLAHSSKGISCQCGEVSIIGNRIMRTQSYSIDVMGAIDGVRIVNNDLIDPVLGTSGGNSHININNTGATNIVIKSNRMSSTAGAARNPARNIENLAGAAVLVEDNELRGVRASGNTPIQNPNDAGLSARRNTEFITENNGTATIASGTTSIAVNHGLTRTPALEDITVVGTNSPTTDPGHVWISGVGATQFTINCRTDPGSGGATFAWAVAIV